METLRCVVGCTSDIDQPEQLFDRNFEFIREFFSRETNENILLDLDLSNLQTPFQIRNPGAVSALELHLMVRQLTQNPSTIRPVNTIALIIARAYKGNELSFGMMFDEGYIYAGDPADQIDIPELQGAPREGCALFLDAISNARGGVGSVDYALESRYTALHELGHVFNLQHQADQDNVMKRSAVSGVPSAADFQLSTADRMRLSQSPLPLKYHPGGSNFGSGATPSSANTAFAREGQDGSSQFRMGASLSNAEAFSFEPIELDIEISILPSAGAVRRIRRAIDTGYDCFNIIIADADGDKRALRSPRQYCMANRWHTIMPTKPFRRDISIGRHMGGAVFGVPGDYEVWVELDLGRRGVLRSNSCTLRIKQDSEMLEADQEARRLLSTKTGVVLGYSRIWMGSRKIREQLTELVVSSPDQSWSPLLRYAIVRAQLEGEQAINSDRNFLTHLEAVLERSLNDKKLSVHRASKLSNLIQGVLPS